MCILESAVERSRKLCDLKILEKFTSRLFDGEDWVEGASGRGVKLDCWGIVKSYWLALLDCVFAIARQLCDWCESLGPGCSIAATNSST